MRRLCVPWPVFIKEGCPSPSVSDAAMPPCDNATAPRELLRSRGRTTKTAMIWIIFGALTAAAIAALIWPVLRPKPGLAGRVEFERAVFRDQLAELERDRARGAIGQAEAEAARNEIVRRLLHAGAAQE